MTSPPIPENEQERLAAVRALGLLDTEHEERFDRYTRFAQRLFNVPFAFVSLIDETRQFFKSIQGADIVETARELSFCAFTINDHVPLIINDALMDERFRDNPLVKGDPGLRFYVGVPLRVAGDLIVGALCVADTEPREFSSDDLAMLKDLGGMLEQEFHSQSLATTDELTGLSNRRGFTTIAHHAIAMCHRLDKPASLMFFDLNKFKAVNDNHGHAEGDKLLQEIGRIMLQEFRNSDVIARLGGDEFCVLLTGTNAEQAERPLQNLQLAFRGLSKRVPYEVSYSVGTIIFDPARHKDVDDLLIDADAAMYREKKARG